MAGRNVSLAAAGAAMLLSFGTTSGVNAQPHPVQDCKPELVKATGQATILGMGRARRLAIDNWQREVRQRYGERYMDFTHARQANSECESASIGTIGQLNKRCTVVGHPCAPGAPIDYLPPAGSPFPSDHNLTCFAQRLLIRLRYLGSDQLDCEYGPVTRRAIVRFQRDNGLHTSGELDPVTLDRLRQVAGNRIG